MQIFELKPEILRQPLPRMPEWFPKALENIATHHNKPFFRVVNGLTETRFLNGNPHHLKHLLHSAPYVDVIHEQFRRSLKNGGYKHYPTWEKAKNDADSSVIPLTEKKAERQMKKYRQPNGRPCWVIEVYQSPDELDAKQWEALRYSFMPKNGVIQKIDMFGEYPSEGRYVYLMSVLDNEGNAISPHQGIIDLLTAGYKARISDTRTYEQILKEDEYNSEMFEEKQKQRLTQHFYDIHGISTKRIKGGVISRPILTEKV